MKRASTVLGPDKTDSLQAFAERIEARLKQCKTAGSAERLICRLMTGKDQKVAALMMGKWVEWRFGKAKETIQVTGHIEHEHFDASRLTDEQLAEAERLIESASAGSNQG